MLMDSPSEWFWDDIDVADFPRLEYSKRDVRRAGDALKTDLVWSDESSNEDIFQIFAIANNWRASHELPMRSIRAGLIWRLRTLNVEFVTAARVKRMSSIRKKLIRRPENLIQIQDLGGCRAIVPSIGDVTNAVLLEKERSRHRFRREDDYITNPKADGYRSHHLVFDYCGEGERESFDGRRIEIQLRTELQHSWATAVEAAGLLLDQDLKAGVGDEDWLRLFVLMSAEIAYSENCPLPPNMPDRQSRIDEICELNNHLGAAGMLDNFQQSVKYIETYATDAWRKPTHFMIEYNNDTLTVEVTAYSSPTRGTAAFDNGERLDRARNKAENNRVFVEAEKVASLRKAYPNYFGDVELFKAQLQRVSNGEMVQPFVLPPQQTAPDAREKPDLRWWFGGRRRR
jgi:hypothetical protein